MNFRVTLAYDGTDYFGWQMQLNKPTIQGVFSGALEKLEGSPVTVFAAGRTDAGVHAEGQVVSFRPRREWTERELVRALNGNLPHDIRVMEASAAGEDFHARMHAKGKVYRYRIYAAQVMNPLLARYAWHFPYRINLERMIEDSRALIGSHDFSAFTVAGCEVRTRIRTISDIQFEREGDLITIFYRGDGFLRYQARTMTSALVDASRGRLKAGTIARLIESRNRSLTGPTAPAGGLTLMKVEY